VMRKKIPIRLRNTFNLTKRGDASSCRNGCPANATSPASRARGYCSFTLQKFLMNREKRVHPEGSCPFSRTWAFPTNTVPSGVDNISVILDQNPAQAEDVNNIIRTIHDDLKPEDIKVEFGIALVGGGGVKGAFAQDRRAGARPRPRCRTRA